MTNGVEIQMRQFQRKLPGKSEGDEGKMDGFPFEFYCLMQLGKAAGSSGAGSTQCTPGALQGSGAAWV